MGYKFNDDTPIYLQIIEYIKTQIICKKYLPKQKLPSVRDLSFELDVNPNTIQKALLELENIGLIFTERTNGKFVTENEEIITEIREQTIKKVIDDFYEDMSRFNINKEQALQILIDKRSRK